MVKPVCAGQLVLLCSHGYNTRCTFLHLLQTVPVRYRVTEEVKTKCFTQISRRYCPQHSHISTYDNDDDNDDCFYIALFFNLEHALCSHVILNK